MQKILTTELLETLISQGFSYCLCRTTTILGADANVCITLVPVKHMPVLKKISGEFDTYFKLTKEPRQMALGIDETIILVDLTEINTYAAMN